MTKKSYVRSAKNQGISKNVLHNAKITFICIVLGNLTKTLKDQGGTITLLLKIMNSLQSSRKRAKIMLVVLVILWQYLYKKLP